jgi:hypothetical protein
MKESATEPSSHFIAINFHAYHDPAAALPCCMSVRRSADLLLKGTGDRVSIVLFYPSSRTVHSEILENVKELDIEIRRLPESTNGAYLNMQVDSALEDGFDYFYRVDADDQVYVDRFARQAAILSSAPYDICGGALVYRNIADGTQFEVVPPAAPTAASFVLNMFFLHPTLAFRLKTFHLHRIKYWTGRLEDKHLALQAHKLGLQVYNDPYIYGEYNLEPNARNTMEAARISLMLDFRFLMPSRNYVLIPISLGIYILRLLVGTHTMRKFRNKVMQYHLRLPLSAFSRSKGSGE